VFADGPLQVIAKAHFFHRQFSRNMVNSLQCATMPRIL
jgi:hypothetical protein